jgi:polyferredoxin
MLPRRIAPFRRTVQFLLLAAIMLMPFISINGNPALRMDIGRRTLFMVGTAIRIDQFYLVLLAALVMVAAFLLLTVVLGKVWCGWLCPQTVLNDLADLSNELL